MARRNLSLQWDSTNSCNLECSHCYHNREGNEGHLQREDEMDLPSIESMFDDLESTSNDWNMDPRVFFSGGEPLLRKDLMKILDMAKKRGITSRLLTNGTLITEEIARELKGRGVDHLQVSLDGDRKRHEKIRRVPGSYDLALEGVRNSKKAGISTNISMTAMRSNIGDFEKVIQAAIKAGSAHVGFQSYVPNPDLGSEDPEYLGAQETLDLFRRTKALARKYASQIKVLQTEVLWQILQDDSPLKEESRREGKYLAGCSAGYFALSVLSNGDVYPCRRLPIKIGHIEEGIKDLILKSPVMQDLRDLRKLKENTRCDMVTHCRGCRAVAYAVTGDYMAKDPMCFKGRE